MGRFSALIMTLVSPYAACFCINLVLAGLVVATQVDPCPNNEHEGTCGYDQAFFLVLTTFHAGSWGHVTPAQSQRVFVSLAAALGFLWPLATLLALLARMHQLVLMRLVAVTLVTSYVSLALIGSLVMAGFIMATTSSEHGDHDFEYGDYFYFVWMTFHMRAYGDILPPSAAVGTALSVITAIAGNMCWALPLLVVVRRTLLDPGAMLFSTAPEGGFQGWFAKAAFAIALPYVLCFMLILLLAAIYHTVQDEDLCESENSCGFGDDFSVLLATFHGATWGHIVPSNDGQRFAACIVATLGYLWRQFVLILLLTRMNQSKLARKYATAVCISYACMAGFGCLIFAALNIAVGGQASGHGYATSLYYTWMSYHGRSYGEVSPNMDHAGESVVAVLIVMMGNMGWVFPLLLAIRESILEAVLSTVRPAEDAPTIAQVVGMPCSAPCSAPAQDVGMATPKECVCSEKPQSGSVFGTREREGAPANYGTVELTHSSKDDVCEDVVRSMYERISDGASRSERIITGNMKIVYVPEEDLVHLLQLYNSNQIRELRAKSKNEDGSRRVLRFFNNDSSPAAGSK